MSDKKEAAPEFGETMGAAENKAKSCNYDSTDGRVGQEKSITIPARPRDPLARPVSLPLRFADPVSVLHFYRKHNDALTWDQVDRLTHLYDRLSKVPQAPQNVVSFVPKSTPQEQTYWEYVE